MLVGHRHHTRQPLEVFHAGDLVVHVGVSGVLMDVFEGFFHPGVVRVQEAFWTTVIA